MPSVQLYIAGPMTGHKDFNYPAFFAAEKALINAGYSVINPADIGAHAGWERPDYLRVCLPQLIELAQGIALLPQWEQSGGARVEAHIGRELGLPVHPLVIWLPHRVLASSTPS